MTIQVKFWGVRGSIACPAREYVKYGGNTSCLEVEANGLHIILDAGTGIRGLGKKFFQREIKKTHLLLTHTHWDHINGFPFFAPAFSPDCEIHIKAGHLKAIGGIQNVIANQMANPTFPVPLEAMNANMTFEDFTAGESFNLSDDVKIVTAPLNHPNGATGYRIEYKDKSFCYITDTEHVVGEIDQNILKLVDGADVVVYDSTYTEEEFPSRIGWGHSTWNEGMKICKEANVKKMVIFHHDPDHEDDFMTKLEEEATSTWDRIIVARDGMELEI
ncbi:MAG: MBL fold metallo-hydrolase [Alphaproteobacteria bacterium]|nr:MBL fold metallo-hydrolase [Rhodospirillales bacterium]MCW9045873.1 MBL fold metallo-hydrolase [Alphaproteobacteria bacterium]